MATELFRDIIYMSYVLAFIVPVASIAAGCLGAWLIGKR